MAPGVRVTVDGDGEFDHSQNDEMRMCGMAGDDEEDDVREDAAVLFGRNAADPLPAEQTDPPSTDDPNPPSSEVRSSNRPSTSKVWDEFEKHYKVENGNKIRYAATCLHCKKRYSAYSANGTGHLTRHLVKCPKKLEKCRMTQTHLAFNSDGSVRRWEYNADVARVELVRMLARLDLPIMIGETDAFKDFIKTAHNPNFQPVSKQTTGRDLFKYYNAKRDKLMACLQDNVVSSVAITSDIWSGKAKEDYLSVVAHFINADWQLEKRVLGLRLIDVSHNADNIAERVHNVLAEYGILNKVFSVTLDNASANKNAMDRLKPVLKEYLGADLFLHQRCACHIINLIVKEALAEVHALIDDFRTAISFLNSSNQRIAAYKSYCIATRVRPRKFSLDMDVRWNSTYLMLKTLLPHKETFSTFIEANYPRAPGSPFLLTDAHWHMASKILKFLELFYDSTVALSGVYYPTAPLMIHHVVKIAIHLHKYQHDEHLRTVVQSMIDKYNKYWKNIPDLYSIAFILDPRAKIKGFTKVLRKLSSLFNTDYTNKLVDTRALLFRMYNRYDAMYGSVRLKRAVPPSLSGKKRTAWADIYDDDELDFGAGCSSLPSSLDQSRGVSATYLMLQAASASNPSNPSNPSNASNASELASYLDCDTVSQLDDDFDLMQWWHEHKLTYPVLSVLAKDIFTVPVSTISSESTFSMTGRIIEERRRRLNPETVEALTCIKDWENAEARLQHMVEDKEMEEAFEALYLDVD
jgi:hypothetical protein